MSTAVALHAVSGVTLTDWLEAALESLSEVATSSMFCDPPVEGERRTTLPHGMEGAIIPVVADQSLQIALFAPKAACGVLARALLGMTPEDELTGQDMADAVGEIINMVAGAAKRRLAGRGVTSQLGLPIFIHGDIEQGVQLDAAVAAVTVCGEHAELVVVGHGRR